MLTLGLGLMIGAQAAGIVEGQHTTADAKEFNKQVVTKTEAIAAATDQDIISQLTVEKNDLRHSELAAIEWKELWAKPAIFAFVVLVIFVLFFRDRASDSVAEPAG